MSEQFKLGQIDLLAIAGKAHKMSNPEDFGTKVMLKNMVPMHISNEFHRNLKESTPPDAYQTYNIAACAMEEVIAKERRTLSLSDEARRERHNRAMAIATAKRNPIYWVQAGKIMNEVIAKVGA